MPLSQCPFIAADNISGKQVDFSSLSSAYRRFRLSFQLCGWTRLLKMPNSLFNSHAEVLGWNIE